MSIYDDQGKTYEGDGMSEQFVKHFEDFLGKAIEVEHIIDAENLFTNKLSNEDADRMVIEVTDKEIKDAMFDIGENKAPGPDGFTSVFFKKAWDTVGDEVCMPLRNFFKRRSC